MTGMVLRYSARIVNPAPEDEVRRFVISYFPADMHTAVFEEPIRNNGFWAGKFVDKRKVINTRTGTYFDFGDFGVGKTVDIVGHTFIMLSADERALQYMESNPDVFPIADPIAISQKLQVLQGEPEMSDRDGIDPDRLKQLMTEMGIEFIDHEIVTLLRAFPIMAADGSPRIDGIRVLACAANS